MLDSINNMRNRVGYYGEVKQVDESGTEVSGKGKYVKVTPVHDQWTRMREDKLRGLRKALYYSYQAAVCQPYNANNDAIVKAIVAIITSIQDNIELTENQIITLIALEEQYPDLAAAEAEFGRTSNEYVAALNNVIADKEGSYFRCLINHDKLKVDYEDKIISIPYIENTVSIDPVRDNDDWIETNFHNGTVFKWIHGNKEEWVPDTYWIVYMQYSEETAYFRGEIRKADEEITIIVVNDDGTETEKTYRGWMTGPNEETLMWNVKKGIVWNDMNYTKKLYITKDEDTLAYFQRFDRVLINGKSWEVQAYNDNYSSSASNPDAGIIRVALKETYTSTDQQIREMNAADQSTDSMIVGPDVLAPYDEVQFSVKDAAAATWEVDIADNNIISYSIDNDVLNIAVLTTKAYRKGFDIKYGDLKKHIVIKSL